jgi:hypothetical protein
MNVMEKSNGNVKVVATSSEYDLIAEFGKDGRIVSAALTKKQTAIGSWAEAAKRIAGGVKGLAEDALGANVAAEDVIVARLAICEGCENRQPCYGDSSAMCCGRLTDVLKPQKPTCGCILSKKTKRKNERCPINKW